MRRFRGLNGEVAFDGKTITVRRHRLLGRSVRKVPLAAVLAVEFKQGGPTLNGYLHILTHGCSNHEGDVQAALSDPQTIMVAAFQNRAFRWLAEELNKAISSDAVQTVSSLASLLG